MSLVVSGCEALRPAAFARSCPDTRTPIDVESLLGWTYQRQRAHIVAERAAGQEIGWVLGRTLDSIERCRRLAETGGRVDGGGPSANHLHGDAELVHAVVNEACREPEELRRYAAALDRPDWMPGATPRMGPVRDGRGRPVIVYPPDDAHRNYGACRVHMEITAEQIARARDGYARWHADLCRVADHPSLRRLQLWAVRGPRVPARPWIENKP